MQAKLLRILETRAFRRVGGSEEIDVSLRIVAATNAHLQDLVKEDRFRLDLFYRLNVYTIHLTPLRERREDILPLAEHFLATYEQARGLQFEGFSPDAQNLLMNYEFPGNARELRHLVERAAILCGSGQIQSEHFTLTQGVVESRPLASQPDADPERVRIVKALEEARWNRRQAADILGMPYSTLRRKIKKFGLVQ